MGEIGKVFFYTFNQIKVMKKEFITYEQALALKEIGFDEPCFGYYNTTWSKQNELLFPQYAGELENWNEMTHLCSAPLYQQAFRWFREKYGLFTQPNRIIDTSGVWYYFSIATKRTDVCEGSFSYEEVELECLKKLIELAKQQS
jgi:hypothetical protein